MRHRLAGKQLCVTTAHRRALLRNLAAALFEHGQIETTPAKAKAVQRYAEKLISMARTKNLAVRRRLESSLTDRRVFAWVAYDSVPEGKKRSPYWDLPPAGEIEFNRYGELRKAPRLIEHLLTNVAPLFKDRPGGYTRIVKLDKRRLGDGTDLVLLQLVGREDGPQVSGRRSNRQAIADKRTAYAAKVRKAGAAS